MTEYFTRTATTHMNQFSKIREAYAANGLDAPNRAAEIRDRINSGSQSVSNVAAALAYSAFETGKSLDDWYEDAVEQIKEAQAREALTQAFNSQYERIVQGSLPRMLGKAVDDLTPSFEERAAEFIAAAKKLPAGDRALDAEANLENNTGKALTTARATLAYFSVMASMFPTLMPGDIRAPKQLLNLLPIVELPEATVELIRPTISEQVSVTNEAQLAGTRTIRAMGDTGRTIKNQTRDLDLILVDVARGLHDGASIKLAKSGELSKRRSTLHAAYERRVKRDTTNKMVAL